MDLNFGSKYVYSYSPVGSLQSLVGDFDRGLRASSSEAYSEDEPRARRGYRRAHRRRASLEDCEFMRLTSRHSPPEIRRCASMESVRPSEPVHVPVPPRRRRRGSLSGGDLFRPIPLPRRRRSSWESLGSGSEEDLWRPPVVQPLRPRPKRRDMTIEIHSEESSEEEVIVIPKPPQHAHHRRRGKVPSRGNKDTYAGEATFIDQESAATAQPYYNFAGSPASPLAKSFMWPRSRFLEQLDGVVRPTNVFLLYCKDSDLAMFPEPYKCTPDDFCENVLLLADVLNSSGGVLCHFDGYDMPKFPSNWSLWTQQMLEHCEFVIAVCSPMLYRVLQDPKHDLINMVRGKFYADAVVNYITPEKFIPVFLNMPAQDEWVPVSLRTSTYYKLDVDDFATAMGDTEPLHPRKFEEKMRTLFDDPHFKSIASLITLLRKDPFIPRPNGPPPSHSPSLSRGFRPLFRPGYGNPYLMRGATDGKVDQRKMRSGKKQAAASGREVRRADTNIVAILYNSLQDSGSLHTGDPEVCGNEHCGAVFSCHSQLQKLPDRDEKVWQCEFCGTENLVNLHPEEVPQEETTTFLLAPCPSAAASGASADSSLVVFCMDISGSMCVTTEVPGRFELKGHDRVHGHTLQSLNEAGEDQFMPNQRRDVTYVSRLQSVQAAVDHQLKNLARTHPSQRVVLVTFGNEVTILGQKKGEDTVVAGDKLWNSEALDKIASSVELPDCIGGTQDALSQKIFDLEEGGQTALGPALLLSVLIASRAPESKVIACTDGQANNGIGGLEDLKTAEARAAAQTFYSDLGLLAQKKGVMVSLVTIKGTDCRIMELGQVADKTGGQVLIVDPLRITQEFSNILANPIIATNVHTKIVLHTKLYVRVQDSGTRESVLKVPVGNVTTETETTYEFGVRARSQHRESGGGQQTSGDVCKDDVKPKDASATKDSPKEVPLLMIDGTPHYPFQVQIEYTSRDGSRLLKVISQTKPKTSEREIAEKEIDIHVVGAHAAHATATLAMEGEYSQARLNAFAIKHLMRRAAGESKDKKTEATSAMEDIISLENILRDKQEKEKKTTASHDTYSADEMEVPSLETVEEAQAKNKKDLRHIQADDEMAALVYQLRRST